MCLRGLCHAFLSIFSLSRYQKTSQANPSVSHKSSVVKILLSKSFCPAVLKDFVGKRFCAVFHKKTVREKNVDKWEGGWGGSQYHGFLSKLFFSQRRKNA